MLALSLGQGFSLEITMGIQRSKPALLGALGCLKLCGLLILALLLGCEAQESAFVNYEPSYAQEALDRPSQLEVRVGIHPLHNPELLFERYGPIVELLNEHINEAHFVLEASRNYEEFELKLAEQRLQLALPNPYQTLKALEQGYHVFGKMADDSVFSGLLLVRKDRGFTQAAELSGETISFPSATALAATMLPQYELQDKGLPWGSYQPLYVGSQESAIMNVFMGKTAAGATWPVPWAAFQKNSPQQAQQLEVLLETRSLVNNSWVAADDLPQNLEQQIGRLLFSLHETDTGRAILAALPLERFEPASNQDYEPVQHFMREFTQHIRPVAP